MTFHVLYGIGALIVVFALFETIGVKTLGTSQKVAVHVLNLFVLFLLAYGSVKL